MQAGRQMVTVAWHSSTDYKVGHELFFQRSEY